MWFGFKKAEKILDTFQSEKQHICVKNIFILRCILFAKDEVTV